MICPLLQILDISSSGGIRHGTEEISKVCLEAGDEEARGDIKGDRGRD